VIARLSLLAAAVALPLALVAAGCGGGGAHRTTTTNPARPVVLHLPAASASFAPYRVDPLLGAGAARYAGPATPHSLAGVHVVKAIRDVVDRPAVAKLLAKQGFAIVSGPYGPSLFHQAYEGNVYSGWPVFVTTDVAYHEWHQVFDKTLRDLEQNVLLPKLQQLVAGLLDAAHAQASELAGTGLAGAASRVEQLYQVAAAELRLPVEPGPLATKELALVAKHDETAPSPITGAKVDYSLFTPRGHYTHTAALTRYFLSLSVLGQAPFCLPGTEECPSGVEPARLGILASRVLARDPRLVALWRDVYEPTAFLVGLADDYTPLEVAAAVRRALPGGLADPGALADDGTVGKVVAALTAARKVQINPERASIRLMGTRFVIDSFVLDQLIAPNVPRRLTPSPLDLAAAFGSDFAHAIQQRTGQTAYPGYETQLTKLKKAIAARPPEAWGSTVYDAWLKAIEPMFLPHGAAFPDFMRSDAWRAKDQQTGFASYAELKHDTILYSKQSFAEGGDTGVPARRNWVEPDPVAFARLAAAADLLRRGLDRRGLLTASQAGLLHTLIGLDDFFERIARDELGGKPISKADNDRLTYIGGELEALWWRTSDLSRHGLPTDPHEDAVVADISSSAKGVLEIGTGGIDTIYVLVPDDGGTFQVAVGGVYSYYEFTEPPGRRLTDEEWHALLRSGKAPPRPAWEDAALAR
jgi:Protein of unknown function (DUF3160)